MKLENLDDEIMVVCALRYCLGRQTYVVGSCASLIKQVWDQLPASSKGVITRDILQAFEEGNVGANMDADIWRNLVRWCFEKLDVETRDWLYKAMMHREDALDALTYDEIGKTVYVEAKDGKLTEGKIVAYSDKHGVCYRVSSYSNLEKDWFDPSEVKWTRHEN